jgi:hypothetical protein
VEGENNSLENSSKTTKLIKITRVMCVIRDIQPQPRDLRHRWRLAHYVGVGTINVIDVKRPLEMTSRQGYVVFNVAESGLKKY